LNEYEGAGSVTIGHNTSPWGIPPYKLTVYGTVHCSAISEGSDARLKDNIRPLGTMLPSILSLSGYKYELKSDTLKKFHIGVLAQELKEVFPELVTADNEGIMSVRYTGLVPVLIEGIKEQQQEINELRKLVNKLLEGAAKDR
jgi:hypothetical protein